MVRAAIPCASLLVAAALLCGGVGPGAAEADPLVDRALARIAARGGRLRTLQARFIQRKMLALFAEAIETRGLLRFRAPATVRWETLAPDASVVLIHGERIELVLPGAPARRLPAGKALGGLAPADLFVWLGVRSDLRARYHVRLDPPPSGVGGDAGGSLRLLLRPRDRALRRRIASVRLTFAADLLVRRIDIREQSGDRTTITLLDVQADAALPPGSFVAPGGAARPDRPRTKKEARSANRS